MTFAQTLRKAIGNSTLTEFRWLTGISVSTLSNLLNEKYHPSPRVMNKLSLADGYFQNGVTFEEFRKCRFTTGTIIDSDVEFYIIRAVRNLFNSERKSLPHVTDLDGVRHSFVFDFEEEEDRILPYRKWVFDIKRKVPGDCSGVLEMLLEPIKNELFKIESFYNKYSLVVYDRFLFDFILANFPDMKINLNYSVILYSSDNYMEEHVLSRVDPSAEDYLVGISR